MIYMRKYPIHRILRQNIYTSFILPLRANCLPRQSTGKIYRVYFFAGALGAAGFFVTGFSFAVGAAGFSAAGGLETAFISATSDASMPCICVSRALRFTYKFCKSKNILSILFMYITPFPFLRQGVFYCLLYLYQARIITSTIHNLGANIIKRINIVLGIFAITEGKQLCIYGTIPCHEILLKVVQ